VEKKGDRLVFLAKGVTPGFANSIRRTILSETPIMAIDEVVILENNSILYDEILAHRIGLVPLVNDVNEIESILESDPEEFKNKEVGFILDVVAEDDEVTVYSGDLKPKSPLEGVAVKEIVRPVSNKIPLVKLSKGQRILLEAYARYGLGKQHAKWQPVSVSAYKYMPIIKIDKEKCILCGLCIGECPKKIFKQEGEEIKIERALECSLCMSCVEVCPASAITVKGDENSIIFKIEGIGVMPPEKVVLLALKVLSFRIRRFKETLRKLIEGGDTPQDTS